MIQVEAGFKIKESKEEAEQILLKNGFINTYKTHTRDIYFGKDVDFRDMDEEGIKNSLIRLRNFERFENMKLFDSEMPDIITLDFKTMLEYLQKLFSQGYDVVFDTRKSDWIYKKGECYHQLQDINDIGLLDYVYNREIFDKGLDADEQFEELKRQMLALGFHLEYEQGVDKLRSLYNQKLMFSTNQIGLYSYQKK